MAELFTNNASSTLAGALAPAGTSITVQTGDGAKFPNPTNPDFFRVVLFKKSAGGTGNVGQIEICICTARVGDVLTITRAQEGTTAIDFSAGDLCELRPTAGFFTSLAQVSTVTIQQDQFNYAADTSVAANSITVTLNPALIAYTVGMPIRFKAANNNTAATTFNAGPGSAYIKKFKNQDLAAGDILAGGIYEVFYDGTYFQLTSTASGQTFNNATLNTPTINTPTIVTPTLSGNMSGGSWTLGHLSPNWLVSGSVTAASVTDLSAMTGGYLSVSGASTTINSFGAAGNNLVTGSIRWIMFLGSYTLANGANMSLPNAQNIVTANGDIGSFLLDGAGVWHLIDYMPYNGQPISAVNVAHGGTGQASLTAHGVLVGNGTGAVNVTAAGTAGQVLTSNGAGADPTWQAGVNPLLLPDAMVLFDGSGASPVIKMSYNVSSVVMNAAHYDFTVNFTTPFSNTNYGALGSCENAGGYPVFSPTYASKTASSFRFQTLYTTGGNISSRDTFVVFYGS